MGQREQKVQVWLIWLMAVLVTIVTPAPFGLSETELLAARQSVQVSTGVVITQERRRQLFPWLPNYRWRKLALKAYRQGHRAYQRARYRFWVTYRLAQLARRGVLTLAWVLDRLTQRQLRRHLGALPLLYTVLDELQVEETINRYCASRCEVSHGTVGLVLVLNRLHAPRPLWRVADWLGQTVLVSVLGLEAAKFNKDRLGRSLDAMAPHCQAIWQAVVSRALARYHIDLRVIYYDLTAFIMHGTYDQSDLVKFGFAHNTPSDKGKVKVGLNAVADGNVPFEYQPWPGDQADKATVETNMNRLAALLKKHGHPLHEVLVVGDRAMLDDRLALLYDEKGLRYLAGLTARKKVHRQLIALTSEADLRRYPLSDQRGRYGYWGRPVAVFFEHDGQEAAHRGLIVLSGPMRFAHYRSRAQQFRTLWQAFKQIQAKADAAQARYRSPQQVQARAETQCRRSPVGQFVTVEADLVGERIVLRWQVKVNQLRQTMHQDGRYLIVTNDPSLTDQRMFALYRAKDGVEKDFRITKSQLKVSPLFLHKDDRIQTMLMLNMVALLAYTILERQTRQAGLSLTTRRLIERLEPLTLIETQWVDGSTGYRLTPTTPAQAELLEALRYIFPQPPTPLSLSPGLASHPATLSTSAAPLTLALAWSARPD